MKPWQLMALSSLIVIAQHFTILTLLFSLYYYNFYDSWGDVKEK